ncbi:MAG: hypothetical protein Unbinned3696contig1008_68 [Prokaryotic dsDNA virus sp.]|nr:MAG: hypothetical protein Unbinned3696contig1008_68 [Prokaryotic dsDNA virus sp.]|tara:strand:- start:183 stop:509 length:327 start_codon:yes stop_codon:yes gene_type:complete
MAAANKTMRIMLSSDLDLRIRRGERIVHVRQIPWELFTDASERQSATNHSQTLDQLNGRGGVAATEAIALISASTWQPMDELLAHRILYAMGAIYRRGKLHADQQEAA